VRLNREEDFLAGIEILEPFFAAQDFQLRVYPPFRDKEGTFYFAQFVQGNHAVTLEHLASLGPVTYSVGSMSIRHEDYLDALGVRIGAAFPAFASDSATGYSALLSDLESRMTPFFEAPDREFMEIAEVHGRRGTAWLPTA